MALKKQTIVKGIDAEYWRIMIINTDCINKRTLVTIGLYLNTEARNENTFNFIITKGIEMKELDVTREQVYNYLKTLDEFKGSEDC